MRPIVRNIHNSELYEFLGGNEFRNVRTGATGTVTDEKAASVFRFNVEATTMLNENPEIFELIKSLNLKFDKS